MRLDLSEFCIHIEDNICPNNVNIFRTDLTGDNWQELWRVLDRGLNEGRSVTPCHAKAAGVAGIPQLGAPGFPRDRFCLRYTLHLPSVKVGSEMNYRFAGVFHALNQRRARLCH
jgi:hypothetical protein